MVLEAIVKPTVPQPMKTKEIFCSSCCTYNNNIIYYLHVPVKMKARKISHFTITKSVAVEFKNIPGILLKKDNIIKCCSIKDEEHCPSFSQISARFCLTDV